MGGRGRGAGAASCAVALMVCASALCPGSSAAAQPQPPEEAPAPDAVDPGSGRDEVLRARLGAGLAHLTIDHRDDADDSMGNLGVALQADLLIPIHGGWSIRPGMVVGFTEFQRIKPVFEAGVGVGAWTVRAYGDVYRWAGRGDRAGRSGRFLGAFLASALLLIPMGLSAALIVLSPFAPYSYSGLDLLGGYRFGDRGVGADVELGWGLRTVLHPRLLQMLAAHGPAFGGGLAFGPLRIGLRVHWAPPRFVDHTVTPATIITSQTTLTLVF